MQDRHVDRMRFPLGSGSMGKFLGNLQQPESVTAATVLSDPLCDDAKESLRKLLRASGLSLWDALTCGTKW